jgi:hypothetical protein
VTNSPYGTFLHGAATGDAVLLELFECWKVAAGGEAAAKSEHARNRANARLRQLEERIRETPAQGLTGIAVKLALRGFITKHSGAETDQSEAAYRDLCRLIGRESLQRPQQLSSEGSLSDVIAGAHGKHELATRHRCVGRGRLVLPNGRSQATLLAPGGLVSYLP